MRKTTKKRLAIAGVTVLLLGGAGAAFAYWTAGGSGTGTAETDTNTPIVAVQTTVITGLQPGDSPQTISGNFNNDNDGPVYVATVTASIASVVPVGAGTCDATDYSLTDAVATVNAQVPAGTGTGAWTGPKIQFNNKPATNQDACKGATVNLAYAIG